jgi:hypothetical protein
MLDQQLNIGVSEENAVTYVLHYFPSIDGEEPFFNVAFSTSSADAEEIQSFHTGNYFCCVPSSIESIRHIVESRIFSEFYSELVLCIHNTEWECIDTQWFDMDDEKIIENISSFIQTLDVQEKNVSSLH